MGLGFLLMALRGGVYAGENTSRKTAGRQTYEIKNTAELFNIPLKEIEGYARRSYTVSGQQSEKPDPVLLKMIKNLPQRPPQESASVNTPVSRPNETPR